MEINKRNRSELKQFFKINDKPTQEEFSDFIDASINQAEDGIVKTQGDPLAIQAEGEGVGSLGVIDVFNSFSDENPEWSINLNPRTDPEVITSNQPGFNIKDVLGLSRLFIKSGNGNVGVGTIEPTSKLTVVGNNTNSLIAAIDKRNEHTTVFEVTNEDNVSQIALRNKDNEKITRISGNSSSQNFFLSNTGVGTKFPKSKLHVSDANAQLRITNTDQTNGTSAKLSLENEGSSVRWDIGVENVQNRLTFGTLNGGTNKFVLSADGKLGLTTLKASNAVEANKITTGSLKAEESVSFGSKKVNHLLQNGVFYRSGSAATLGVKSFFFIRDTNDNTSSLQFYFDTKEARLGVGGSSKPAAPLSIRGTGKDISPDGSMHITENSILFGGRNSGKQAESGQIVVSKYAPDSLNIVGVGADRTNRKIDLWAEGAMNVRGTIKTPESLAVAFSVSLSAHMSGAKNPISFGHTNYNVGAHFENNTHFTAPVKGIYLFTVTMRVRGGSLNWRLRLNGSGYVNGAVFDGGTLTNTQNEMKREPSQVSAVIDYHTASRTVTAFLNANDKVHVEQTTGGITDNFSSGFEGVLLQALMD